MTDEDRKALALAAHDRGLMLDVRIQSIYLAIRELQTVRDALIAEHAQAVELMEALQ